MIQLQKLLLRNTKSLYYVINRDMYDTLYSLLSYFFQLLLKKQTTNKSQEYWTFMLLDTFLQ